MRSELTSLTGVAGEHYVLFELLRKGYIAALAPTGSGCRYRGDNSLCRRRNSTLGVPGA